MLSVSISSFVSMDQLSMDPWLKKKCQEVNCLMVIVFLLVIKRLRESRVSCVADSAPGGSLDRAQKGGASL